MVSGEYVMERHDCAELSDALLLPLHALANTLMAEPYDHFVVHARTNHVLHVFRRSASTEVVGFQFWRCFDGAPETGRVVLGGKLRVHPCARRQGLHLISGLEVLLAEQARVPGQLITRLSVASIFGFCSIARRLAHYHFIDARGPHRHLVPLVERATSTSHYQLDPETGAVSVGIFMTDEQAARYPASFYESREARAYAERNPGFRDNGKYLAFAFPVDRANIEALARGAAEAVAGPSERSDELARRTVAEWLVNAPGAPG